LNLTLEVISTPAIGHGGRRSKEPLRGPARQAQPAFPSSTTGGSWAAANPGDSGKRVITMTKAVETAPGSLLSRVSGTPVNGAAAQNRALSIEPLANAERVLLVCRDECHGAVR
jgi:hypothetical protein